jgi:hypothetical protein
MMMNNNNKKKSLMDMKINIEKPREFLRFVKKLKNLHISEKYRKFKEEISFVLMFTLRIFSPSE